MLRDVVVNRSVKPSILKSTSILAPDGATGKKTIVADLLLTALIDAFSILVIFLLMNFSSTGEILFINKGAELPKASQAEFLERHPVVKVDEGKLFLEDQQLTGDQLTAALLDLRKKYQNNPQMGEFKDILTIQADRRVKYEVLNQIVLAAAQSGMSDIKFAILMK